MIKTEALTIRELEVIFDVLNVYDPNDIKHVYPEMGTEEFMLEVNALWKKVLDMIKEDDHNKAYDKLQDSAKILFDRELNA